MGFISETTDTYLVTPEKAKDWLTDHWFEHQRTPVSQERIDLYAQQMTEGNWQVGDGSIILSSVGKSTYLTAGYHRLHAVIQADKPVMLRVVRQKYESYEDVIRHYADGTNRNFNATKGSQFQVLGTSEATGFPLRFLRYIPPAIILIGNGFKTQVARSRAGKIVMASPSDMDAYVRQWQTPFYAFMKATEWQSHRESQRTIWYRSPVMAVAALTYRYAPEKAEQFWRLMIRNDSLPAESPHALLRDFLINTTLEFTDPERYAGKVAAAWSHFYDGKARLQRLQMVRKDNDGTISIKGTPFKGEPGFGGFDPLSLLRK